MGNLTSILITMSDGKDIFRVGLKAESIILTDDVCKYYNEPENKKVILDLLPSYCKNSFNIVEVKQIFEIIVIQ